MAANIAVSNWFTLKSRFYSADTSFGCKNETIGNTCEDCKTLVRCSDGKKVACGNMDHTKPYCNPITKTCQTENTCGAPDMMCPYKGFFPEPMLCNHFQFCSDAGVKSTSYECPLGHRWDALKQLCCQTEICTNFSMFNGLCKENIFQFVQHPQLPYLYMFCDGDNYLEACKSPWEQLVDLEKGVCQFVCPYPGFFPDYTNEKKYWNCVTENDTTVAYSMDCAEGTTFQTEFCMPSVETESEEVNP